MIAGRPSSRHLWVGTLLCLGLRIAPVLGAAAPTTQPDAGTPQDPLATKQQIIRDRMTQLEDRMYRLTEKLTSTEPQQAKRLETALRQARELLIRRNMEEVTALLEAGKVSDAADREAAIIRDLEHVLQTLMEDADQSKERRDELNRLKAAQRQVQELLDAEQRMKAQSDSVPQRQQLLAAIRAAIARLEGVIGRQQKEIARTSEVQPGDSARSARDSQRQIREETESLAQGLRQTAASGPGEPPPPNAESVPQSAPASSPAGTRQNASPQKSDEAAIQAGMQDASQKLGEAGDKMKAAEQQLEGNLPAGANSEQKNAINHLRTALDQLKKQEADAGKKLNQAEAARRQLELQKKANELAQQMQGGQQAQADGGPKQPGQNGGQQSGQGKPQDGQNGAQSRPADAGSQQELVPGAQDIQDAGGHMGDAAQDLDRNKPSDASKNQQKAIDKLQQAQRELEQALEQKRREQQEEILRGLETRFRAMLAAQLLINQGTQELDAKPRESWVHADELKLSTHARDESKLAGDAGQALQILTEDGTSIVFPRIVTQVREDMEEVARLLTGRQTGEATRTVQQSIVAALQELIEAIHEMRNDLQAQQSMQGGGGSGNEPLLPNSAELKLLRSCQERVNHRTLELAGQLQRSGAETEQAHKASRALADRQREIADMARKMHERLTGQ